MKKFFVLLRKELKEMLTVEVLGPLFLTALIFFFLGNVLAKEQTSSSLSAEVNILNFDKSAASESFIEILNKSKVNTTIIDTATLEEALARTKREKKTALLEIPAGFELGLGTDKSKTIGVYTIIDNFSALGNKGYSILAAGIFGANEVFGNQLVSSMVESTQDPTFFKNPISSEENVVIGDRRAQVNINAIMNFVSQQTVFVPLIIFSVIFFAVQMIAIAIASEKENKTLETLLTTPVSRKAIVYSKMSAAGLIAIIATAIYILGFRSYIDGLFAGSDISAGVGDAIKVLGLNFTFYSYFLLGLSMFAGILAALAVAFNLGAFAKDVKSVAGLLSPLTVLIMVPYLLTMFLDVNAAAPVLKYILYAIPFTHIFMAAPNIFLHRYDLVIYGIIYELIWFIGFAYLAIKIFSSEKILIMDLNLFKKKKRAD